MLGKVFETAEISNFLENQGPAIPPPYAGTIQVFDGISFGRNAKATAPEKTDRLRNTTQNKCTNTFKFNPLFLPTKVKVRMDWAQLRNEVTYAFKNWTTYIIARSF